MRFHFHGRFLAGNCSCDEKPIIPILKTARQRPYVATSDAQSQQYLFHHKMPQHHSQDDERMTPTKVSQMTRSGRSSMIRNGSEGQERIMMKSPLRLRIVVFALFLVSFTFCLSTTEAFSNDACTSFQRRQGNAAISDNTRVPLLPLLAKKKSSKARASGSTGGFGGAAAELCVCGSGLGYNKCCGKLHQDDKAYAAATASQVVRARYSGYAKRVIDFIIASTHPLNPSFEQDMEHWKKTMEDDCFDNFELTKCEILEESYSGKDADEQATVRFRTQMTQRDTEERSAFIETSTFERDAKSGAWLYRDGVVAQVDVATKKA